MGSQAALNKDKTRLFQSFRAAFIVRKPEQQRHDKKQYLFQNYSPLTT